MLGERGGSMEDVPITEFTKNGQKSRLDTLATEEPLEIRLLKYDDTSKDWDRHNIAVTMRTPGNDFELAAGFLFSEGVIRYKKDIEKISYCTDPGERQQYNIVNVYLSEGIRFDAAQLSRHVYTTSSCGVCGKGSIEQVRAVRLSKPIGKLQVSFDRLSSLSSKLNAAQNIFSHTGGLHASGLFDPDGTLLISREDVGRHNALDKLIGSLLLKDKIPASDTILLVSGRASFELVQKAVLAGIPFMAAVGAPSNLAVSLAIEFEMTLVGFLKRERFNVYSARERIKE
jgi:FdhD protein